MIEMQIIYAEINEYLTTKGVHMSGLVVATLRDGSQVPRGTLIAVTMNIRQARDENDAALFDLVEKCKDAGYKFTANPSRDSKATLRKFNLIDSDERVHVDIRKIVLNSIVGEGSSLKLVDTRKT